MCGFAGFTGSGDNNDLRAMCRALSHRGPDEEAISVHDSDQTPVRLGFRRLAILDIDGGRQPMATTDGSVEVVFNGEIYNAPDLRKELEAAGHVFKSDHSDTEVLLHGYRHWGDRLVEHLSGMFAFVIYDRPRRRLVLARDPYGKKPLYYSTTGSGIVFASEMTALCLHPAVKLVVEPSCIAKYLAFGFIPAPMTLYRGIAKLEAGSVATYDLQSEQLDVRKYWSYRIAVGKTPDGDPSDWAAELRDLLTNAVEKRLQSDVPIGFLLSGGIDSAIVLALARKIAPDTAAKSFTIGFGESSYDESANARAVAKALGSTHHEKMLDLRTAEHLVTNVLGRMDEPVADPSILPTYLLSGFARETVTVALSGDGGDELFAGYDTFAAMPLAKLYRCMVPGPMHRVVQSLANRLPKGTSNLSFDFKVRTALKGLCYDEPLWHAAWLAPTDANERAALMGRGVTTQEIYGEVEDHWRGSESTNSTDRALEYYARYYLGDDILPKVDRASMMHSLEVRSPFLDRELSDFVLRLPANVKHKGNVRKWLLRKAFEDILPTAPLKQPKKGFGIPVSAWLRKWPMPDAKRMEDIGLNTAYLRQRWEAHKKGAEDNRGLLWAWLCLDQCLLNHDTVRRECMTQSVA
jgi:asparagine synthase (glutamine-hydrolysing)